MTSPTDLRGPALSSQSARANSPSSVASINNNRLPFTAFMNRRSTAPTASTSSARPYPDSDALTSPTSSKSRRLSKIFSNSFMIKKSHPVQASESSPALTTPHSPISQSAQSVLSLDQISLDRQRDPIRAAALGKGSPSAVGSFNSDSCLRPPEFPATPCTGETPTANYSTSSKLVSAQQDIKAGLSSTLSLKASSSPPLQTTSTTNTTSSSLLSADCTADAALSRTNPSPCSSDPSPASAGSFPCSSSYSSLPFSPKTTTAASSAVIGLSIDPSSRLPASSKSNTSLGNSSSVLSGLASASYSFENNNGPPVSPSQRALSFSSESLDRTGIVPVVSFVLLPTQDLSTCAPSTSKAERDSEDRGHLTSHSDLKLTSSDPLSESLAPLAASATWPASSASGTSAQMITSSSKPEMAPSPSPSSMELGTATPGPRAQEISDSPQELSDVEIDSPPPQADNSVPSSSSNSPVAASLERRHVQTLVLPESATREPALEEEEDPYSIRLTPFIDHSSSTPALYITTVERKAHDGMVIKVGRYTERKETPAPKPEHAPIVFRSKVVSRSHAQLSCVNGNWFVKDVKSSSGTFLNQVRLSPACQESQPFALKDGDILQLGMDFRGGSEEIYKCIKVRVQVNKSWQAKANNFKYVTKLSFGSFLF